MKAGNCTLIEPLCCKNDLSLVEAAKMLREKKQRRILAVDENEAPVGILSTTDISNKVVAEGKNPVDLKVGDVMTVPIHLVSDVEEDINQIYKKMVDKKTFFVPITKEGRLYGVLTYAELMRRAQELLEQRLDEAEKTK